MIIGALTSLYVAVETGIAVGLLAGALAGAALALLMVWLCVRLNANQVVVGFGITILGVGLTGYIFHLSTPLGGERRQLGILSEIHIPGLSDIPFLGEAFLSNSWMTWLAFGLVPVVWWLAQRTVFGLEVRAVGEDPDAAFARGVDVIRVRSIATLISGLLAGLGGAAITTALVGVFEPAITAGRGFIALIVIIMVRWSAWGVAVGSFAFGLADALGANLRNIVSDRRAHRSPADDPVLRGADHPDHRRPPGAHAQVAGLQLRARPVATGITSRSRIMTTDPDTDRSFLIRGGIVLPMEGRQVYHDPGSVLVLDGTIAAVGGVEEVDRPSGRRARPHHRRRPPCGDPRHPQLPSAFGPAARHRRVAGAVGVAGEPHRPGAQGAHPRDRRGGVLDGLHGGRARRNHLGAGHVAAHGGLGPGRRGDRHPGHAGSLHRRPVRLLRVAGDQPPAAGNPPGSPPAGGSAPGWASSTSSTAPPTCSAAPPPWPRSSTLASTRTPRSPSGRCRSACGSSAGVPSRSSTSAASWDPPR